jgi:hypothetical protein
MTTDASKTGWGCSLAGTPTGGSRDPGESEKHINWLEVKAILHITQSKIICRSYLSEACKNPIRQHNGSLLYKSYGN